MNFGAARVVALTFVLSLLVEVNGWFYGICYSPYSKMGVCRTAEELEDDYALMRQHTDRIRLYSMECPDVMHGLLKKASAGEVTLLLGVWMENPQRDQKELNLLIEYLKQYPHASLAGIVIGNEVLFRRQASPEYMGYFVTEAKNRVRGLGNAVGSYVLQTVEIFSVEETPNPGVVAVSDAVGVNIHPYYDFTLQKKSDPHELGVSAADRFKLKLDAHRSHFPGKKIIVTEVGWPSSSDMYSGDTQLGSDMAQLYFVQALLAIIAQDPVPYYYFEFRNAAWKNFGQKSGAHSEYNFGLFDSTGVPKAALG